MFILSVSAQSAAKESNLSDKTTLSVYHLMRRGIAEELARDDLILKGEITG
jgi:hypothetical protein